MILQCRRLATMVTILDAIIELTTPFSIFRCAYNPNTFGPLNVLIILLYPLQPVFFYFSYFTGEVVKLLQILYCISLYLYFSLVVDTPLQLQNHRREELIKQYFNQGFSYDEILKFLSSQHDIILSQRHLHRLLRQEKIFRRKNKSTIDEVMDQIEFLLANTSAKNFGYRMMTEKLRSLGPCCFQEYSQIVFEVP